MMRKRLFGLLLTFVMVFSFGAAVFADIGYPGPFPRPRSAPICEPAPPPVDPCDYEILP